MSSDPLRKECEELLASLRTVTVGNALMTKSDVDTLEAFALRMKQEAREATLAAIVCAECKGDGRGPSLAINEDICEPLCSVCDGSGIEAEAYFRARAEEVSQHEP